MINLIFDMETGGDPDDIFTLYFLLGHPQVNLKAITLVPGGADEIGVVRRILSQFGREDIPVGAYNVDREKESALKWYYKVYGYAPPSRNAEPAPELLTRLCDEHTTLITGGPLQNLGAAIRDYPDQFRLGRWVCQGGFAGEGVVPAEKQLAKFKGLTTCPTFNLNGHPKSALAALAYPGIGERYFVSKNVCHGVIYDAALHEIVGAVKDRSQSLTYIHRGMTAYLREEPEGKKFHDPLAACCAIDPQIGTWAEVEVYREHGEWGSRLSEGSGTWIITDYDRERFINVLTAI